MSVLDSRPSLRRRTSAGVVYQRRGTGTPIVLLHGWCLNRDIWCYEEDMLAEGHDVITPDLPGFGDSADVPWPHDLSGYVDALHGLLDELELRQATLVGFAFGGAIAMAAAARDDSRIAGLVVVGVPSAEVFPANRMARSIRRDWPDFGRRSARVLCKQPQSDATIEWVEHMFRATAMAVALETAALLGGFAPEPLCDLVSVPILFVHGADDAVIPSSVSERCAVLAATGQAEIIPDCGHLVVLDQRQAFHAVLERFLTRKT